MPIATRWLKIGLVLCIILNLVMIVFEVQEGVAFLSPLQVLAIVFCSYAFSLVKRANR
jgi:hypothetical protein